MRPKGGLESKGRRCPWKQNIHRLNGARVTRVTADGIPDDLLREVYCLLGMPVDAIEMSFVLRRVESAAINKWPYLISTPNLNFLVNSQSDPEFRESLLLSDLCVADGVSIVLLARLIGVPIKDRVAGSDIFEALKVRGLMAPLKVFLFGGAEGIGEAACRALNIQPRGLCCVGSLYPGFRSVEEMSGDETIDQLNSSKADVLVVSLGSNKGQSWLLRNHHRLLIPVRAHLGAVINFQAAKVKRAPLIVRKCGLEWLWRIKEEPHLWRRYWKDGTVLVQLLLTGVIPLLFWTGWLRLRYARYGKDLIVKQAQDNESVVVSLHGCATAAHIHKIVPVFRDAISGGKHIILDFYEVRVVDARFLGLLLMLRKKLRGTGADLTFGNMLPGLKYIFSLNGLLSLEPIGEAHVERV